VGSQRLTASAIVSKPNWRLLAFNRIKEEEGRRGRTVRVLMLWYEVFATVVTKKIKKKAGVKE
jgi:hypothetical protein